MSSLSNAQKDDPLPGDFFQLVQGDLQLMGAELSDQYIQQSSRNALKSEIKQKTKNAAFRYLKNLQSQHSKISDIEYPIFETQKYMTSPIYNKVNLLHDLRSGKTISFQSTEIICLAHFESLNKCMYLEKGKQEKK